MTSRFTGRLSADGSSGYRAEPGRFHIYAGAFCPWSQRVLIERALNGLQDAVTTSYVEDARDPRDPQGWAFGPQRGPDPVNGFGLLREAYARTEPGVDGRVTVPTLWDRETGRVVSNDFRTIGIDLATEFGASAGTYELADRTRIEELDAWLGPAVNKGAGLALGDFAARAELIDAFDALDALLADQRYLLGERITEADVRLWVTLVRFDAGLNAGRHILPRGLAEFPRLWAYSRDRLTHPAFSSTTVFDAFTVPGAQLLDWAEPAGRAELGSAVRRSRPSTFTQGARRAQ